MFAQHGDVSSEEDDTDDNRISLKKKFMKQLKEKNSEILNLKENITTLEEINRDIQVDNEKLNQKSMVCADEITRLKQ